MKVGTDSVLLGAWAHLDNPQFILDIGAGSGLITLMMAQRSGPTAHIDGVEMERQDAMQATQNALECPWSEKISIHHASIQKFTSPHLYDIVISNPPYFINSAHPPDTGRVHTRHTVSLDYNTLLKNIKRFLSKDGNANVILPAIEGQLFISLAREYGFFPTRNVLFRTRPEKAAERLLLELRLTPAIIEIGEILLYRDGSNWSKEYRKLVEEFYLATF